MNKKKPFRILSFVLLTLSVLSLLTGCVRSGVGIVVQPDDTGDVELSFGISRESYQMFLDQYGSELYEGKETFEIKDGDTTYICVSEHQPFQNLDELKQILLDLKYTSEEELIAAEEYDESQDKDTHIFKSVEIEKNKDFFETTYHMTLVTNAFPASSEELSLYGFDAENFYKVLVSVTLPGNVQAEGAAVKNNTASFKLTNMEEEKTLTVDSSALDTVRIVALVIAIITIILLIALFTKNGKKKANT